MLIPWKKNYDKPRQLFNMQRHHFANNHPPSQSYCFYSSHVQMWELDQKECWTSKNWCFQIMLLEKSLKSPLDSEEIKPVNPKGNQPWILIHWKDWCWSWSSNTLATWCKEPVLWDDLMLGKIEGRRRRGKQRMRLLDGITDSMNMKFEQTPGDSEGQGSLACCKSRSCKELDMI